MITWTTLGMATPQKPIPAPIDRFKEKMAMEARAWCQISNWLVLWTYRLCCMSNILKTHRHTGIPCIFVCWEQENIAKIIAFACLPPEAGTSMICHHRICSRINLPSLTTVQALLRHDWHLNWKRCRCVLLSQNKQTMSSSHARWR